MSVISLRLPAQCNVLVRVNHFNLPKGKITRGTIRAPTVKDLHICSPVSYRCATLNGFKSISISVCKPSTHENNTLFEMSVSREINKFLLFFQSA